MPVGSEWWGAKLKKENESLKKQVESPMPVGSEWWGANFDVVKWRQSFSGVANACRQ